MNTAVFHCMGLVGQGHVTILHSGCLILRLSVKNWQLCGRSGDEAGICVLTDVLESAWDQGSMQESLHYISHRCYPCMYPCMYPTAVLLTIPSFLRISNNVIQKDPERSPLTCNTVNKSSTESGPESQIQILTSRLVYIVFIFWTIMLFSYTQKLPIILLQRTDYMFKLRKGTSFWFSWSCQYWGVTGVHKQNRYYFRD